VIIKENKKMGGVNTTIDNSEEIVRETHKILNSLLIENSSICSSKNQSSQVINIGDMEFNNCASVDIGANQTMTISNDFSCLSDQSTNSEILQDFKTKMVQASKAPGNPINKGLSAGLLTGISVGVSVDTQVNNSKKTYDYLMESITEQTIKNISACASENLNQQLQNIGNIKVNCPLGGTVDLTKISQDMVANSISSCTSKIVNVPKSSLSSSVDVEQSTTTGGSKPNGGASGMIGGGVVCIIIAIILFWYGREQVDYSYNVAGAFFFIVGLALIIIGALSLAKVPGAPEI
jgi:hypothetical protein